MGCTFSGGHGLCSGVMGCVVGGHGLCRGVMGCVVGGHGLCSGGSWVV